MNRGLSYYSSWRHTVLANLYGVAREADARSQASKLAGLPSEASQVLRIFPTWDQLRPQYIIATLHATESKKPVYASSHIPVTTCRRLGLLINYTLTEECSNNRLKSLSDLTSVGTNASTIQILFTFKVLCQYDLFN